MKRGRPIPRDKREKVLDLAATSMTKKQVAEEVGISPRSVGRIWDAKGVVRVVEGQSEDSVRVSRRRQPASLREQALVRHADGLVALSQQLVSQATVPLPHSMLGQPTALWPYPWLGVSGEPPVLEVEEDPLYPDLIAHLEGSDVAEALDRLRQGLITYRKDALRLADKADTELGRNVRGGQVVEGLGLAAMPSLILDAYYRAKGLEGIAFTYQVKPMQDGSESWLKMSLGEGSVRFESEEQAALIRRWHDDARSALAESREVIVIAEVSRELVAYCRSIKRSLSPEDRARKLIVVGHCEDCP